MTSWYSLEVGDGVDAFEPSMKLHQAFMQFALASSGIVPKGAGVFSNYDLEVNVVTWYFSPDAEPLAHTFGALPCEKPEPREGFGLLVGDTRAWEEYFPDYIAQRRRR